MKTVTISKFSFNSFNMGIYECFYLWPCILKIIQWIKLRSTASFLLLFYHKLQLWQTQTQNTHIQLWEFQVEIKYVCQFYLKNTNNWNSKKIFWDFFYD